MNRIFYFILFSLLLLKTQVLLSQKLTLKEPDIEAFIENLFAIQDDDINYEELYETLYQYYQNPINLNRTNREELQSLFILSEIQLNNFFSYIRDNGKLLTIYELQAIPGFDLSTIHKLLPFVKVYKINSNVDARPLKHRIFNEGNSYFLIRHERTLEQKKGFTPPDLKPDSTLTSRYQGTPDKLYARFRVSNPGDFSIGFTAEKDAGEQWTWDKQHNRYGMDFFSYHIFVKNKGRLKALALGDYQLQLGQGLLLGAGFTVGKGAETITTIRRSNLGILPYTSVLEYGFFRGAAATITSGPFDLTLFYSKTNHDGSALEQGPLGDHATIASSIQSTGLHRTLSEIQSKDQVNEQVFGTNVYYKSKDRKFQAGFTYLRTFFDVFIGRAPRLYNQFEFNGESNFSIGTYYSYNWQNFNFFGEAAQSQSGGLGFVNGFVASLSKSIEMSLLFRSYDRDFHSFYGNAFSENTRNINEKGWYMGLKFSPDQKYFFSAYYDSFTFPWLKFRTDAPSQGYEYLVRANYKPTKLMLLYLQFRQEEKARNINDEKQNINFPKAAKKSSLLLNVDYKPKQVVSLRTRVQFSTMNFNNEVTNGYILAQDLNLNVGKLIISARIALFDTDNYDNRQYVYEKDVLYSFSIPAFSGVGVRNYILFQYKLSKKLNIWFKYARTRYNDRDTIGSGLESIDGNTKTDIKLQVRYKF